jgi:hypothetical protein
MAWFIMRNQSRFLFSHEHTYAAFHGLLGQSHPSRIICVNANAHVLNRINDYVFRPRELENVDWYHFVACYDVVHRTEKNRDQIYRFSSTAHPQYAIRGVMEREHMASPLVSYLDWPCASEFEGSIMDESIIPNLAMEKFAKVTLCLLVPFRDEERLRSTDGNGYTQMLQTAVKANAIERKSLLLLQNIQNCHNLMRAGRQKDILERVTLPLPAPVKTKPTDYDEETQKQLENHIEMALTELVADLDEDNELRSIDAPMSLREMRNKGKHNCGYAGVRAIAVDESSCLFQIRGENGGNNENVTDNDTERTSGGSVQTDKIMSKARLTRLSIVAVR